MMIKYLKFKNHIGRCHIYIIIYIYIIIVFLLAILSAFNGLKTNSVLLRVNKYAVTTLSAVTADYSSATNYWTHLDYAY